MIDFRVLVRTLKTLKQQETADAVFIPSPLIVLFIPLVHIHQAGSTRDKPTSRGHSTASTSSRLLADVYSGPAMSQELPMHGLERN